MKDFFSLISPDEYKKIIETGANIDKIISKNSFECDNVKELVIMANDIQKNFFISQLRIIKVLNCEEYNKLCLMDPLARNGLNYKTVTQIENYRFNENCIVNDNVLTRRYFILDFNKTITVDGEECTNQIYELDMKSFCILVCEVCTAKQDIEDKLYINEAKKYLDHMERVIERFIEKYFELRELNKEINKRN